jgi:hypothetical protein
VKRLGNWVIHQIIVCVQRLMDSSLTSPTDVLLGTLSSIFSQVDPQLLQAHPHNSSIYGEEDVTDLVELIRQSKWIKPLVVTSSLTIISGHRRWKAVLKLGWSTVPIEVRELATEEEELEALLLENASRVKTTEQKVREAEAWKSLEQCQARKRMSEAGQKSAPGKPAEEKGVENFPHLSSKGKTRDRLAKLVGLGSGRTYSKAAKVVEVIDRETCSGNLETAQTLRQALNSKSVDAAWNLLKHPQQLTSRKSDIALGNGTSATRSCWSCQHRGELIGNDSFYCERLGRLSLLEQDADTRGDSCELWSQIQDTTSQTKNYTLTLSFSPELRSLLEDTARDAGMSVVDWAHYQLKKAALSTNRANQPGRLQPLLNEQFIEQWSGRGQN